MSKETDSSENEERKPHPMVKEVVKMLKEQHLEWASPQVVANLTRVAEKMAIEMLRNAAYYTGKEVYESRDGDDDEFYPESMEKEDILLAIRLRQPNDVKLPNEDALIDAAVAVNGNSLVVREKFGIPLPKDNLGNCNYQLQNQSKRIKMESDRHSRPYYACIVPYKSYKSSHHASTNNYMFKQPMRVRNANTSEQPMRITIMPRYGMMPPMYGHGQSVLKKHFDQQYD